MEVLAEVFEDYGALDLPALFLIKEGGEEKDQQAGRVIAPLVEDIPFEGADQQGNKREAGGGPERIEFFLA